MATMLSKTFDTAHGSVFLEVKDVHLGNITKHTLYVANTPDVNAAIDQILADADTNAQIVKDKMIAAGWQPNGN